MLQCFLWIHTGIMSSNQHCQHQGSANSKTLCVLWLHVCALIFPYNVVWAISPFASYWSLTCRVMSGMPWSNWSNKIRWWCRATSLAKSYLLGLTREEYKHALLLLCIVPKTTHTARGCTCLHCLSVPLLWYQTLHCLCLGCVSFVVYLVLFNFVTFDAIVGLATENRSDWTTEWTILNNSLLYRLLRTYMRAEACDETQW